MEEKILNFQIINQLELDEKYITCTKCKIWLTTPIILLPDGSNYCEPCASLSTPPESDGKRQQNNALEHVLSNMKYPCMFKNCDFIESQENILNHMKICMKGLFTCAFCKEANLNESSVTTHLEEKHAKIVTQKTIADPVAILSVTKHMKEKIFVITLKDNILVIFVTFANGILSFKVGKQKLDDSVLDDSFLIQYTTNDNELRVKGKTSSMKEIIENFQSKWKLQMNLSSFEDIDSNEFELNIYFNGFKLMQCIIDDCPICLNKLTKQIYQCSNGHNVCSHCIENLDTCAICKGPLNKTKIDLKHVFSNIPFPCPNADTGCIHFMTSNDLDTHTVDCLYAKVNCTMCKDDIPKHKIITHMNEQHASIRKNLETIRELEVDNTFGNLISHVIFKNKIFRFTRITTGSENDQKLNYNVQLLHNDDKSKAHKYRYEIHILSENAKQIATHKVDNICQSFADDSISSTINWNVCKQFVHKHENETSFCYRYCIYEFNR